MTTNELFETKMLPALEEVVRMGLIDRDVITKAREQWNKGYLPLYGAAPIATECPIDWRGELNAEVEGETLILNCGNSNI